MGVKVVIIGGGISGLTAGIYAQKAGFSTEIYEKNNLMGGACTGWNREGFHIDNCIHWLMGCTKGTTLNRIWHEVDAINEQIEVIRPNYMYASELDGQRITLWQDLERTKQELLALSPDDAEEIKKLIYAIEKGRQVAIPADKPPELFNPADYFKMAATMKDALQLFKLFAGQDTHDLMARFKHPLIRCMISDFCPADSLALSFPMAYGNFVSGDGGIPSGGSRAMALRMQKRFVDLGGTVNTGVEAITLNVQDEEGKSLVLANNRRIEGDWFICACDPSYTFGHLLARSYIDPVLQMMYDNPKGYRLYGMFQVAYAVDSPINALGGDIMMDCPTICEHSWWGRRMSVKNYAYEPSFAPTGKQIVQVLVGLDVYAYDYWQHLYQDQAAYQAHKLELAQKIMVRLEERFPEYRGKMTILDSWTPITYERYCHAYKGYNQSFTPTKHSKMNVYPSGYIQGLNNVLLAGQWLSPPGGLPGAAIQGKFAIQRILHQLGRNIKI